MDLSIYATRTLYHGPFDGHSRQMARDEFTDAIPRHILSTNALVLSVAGDALSVGFVRVPDIVALNGYCTLFPAHVRSVGKSLLQHNHGLALMAST
jgi:hypothetical protein